MSADNTARRRGAPGDPVFVKRVVSALVLAPVAILLVWAGGTAFSIFVAAFAAAMAWEWVRMSDRAAPPRAFAIATGAAVGAALLAGQGEPLWTLAWIAGGAVCAGLDRRRRGRALDAMIGAAYVAGAAAMLVSLREGEQGGLTAVLFLLAVVWAADTFAYLAGSWIGGPKLLPAASPNKTWAGLAAGLICGTAAGAGVAALVGFDPVYAAMVALPTALAAVMGDLAMSLAKRRFGVKDAGDLIPGHGGVLDRVDALMLAVLFAGAWRALGPDGWPGAGL
ncbi:phosphatidate cytidylyltransferase [Alkalicaulis satelles]|uniref:Phosphatidate cytidylyltransferase n=1 Tax=Alkalicaulis satelles TaxID=2609175 RepID=A0A5M6ZA59_9PROT|nr:phosphatidate cytidylyltransferase [Alkalicaulis satelles]KAA5801586.1 phosphatidate cytidylyltransferase [Alkalicaulis satelles]